MLLDVVEGIATFLLEILELLDHLPEHTLLQQAVHKLVMLFRGVKPGEDFHGVDDLPFLLGLLAFLLLHLLEVEEASFEHELLPPNSLVDPRVVEFDDIIFEFEVLLRIILEEFQISQQGVRIRIILVVEVTSLRHVTNDGVEVRQVGPATGARLLSLGPPLVLLTI